MGGAEPAVLLLVPLGGERGVQVRQRLPRRGRLAAGGERLVGGFRPEARGGEVGREAGPEGGRDDRKQHPDERVEILFPDPAVPANDVGVRDPREGRLPDAEHREPGGGERAGLPRIHHPPLVVVPVAVHFHGHALRAKEAVDLDAGHPCMPRSVGDQVGELGHYPKLHERGPPAELAGTPR
jgi:hypothetical protein